MQKVTKMVFPVAGFGTRFLPATKAMPKELLPILDKPLIQFAVEEACEAGFDTLIFVTGRNKRAIEDHFDKNRELESELVFRGQTDKVEIIRNILPDNVQCVFVRQPEPLGLGHAVLCAERVVGKEPFAVALADDFIVNNNESILSQLIKAYEDSGKSQLSVMRVDGPDISKFGVILPNDNEVGVDGIIEKPKEEEAPSNLASIGRYVLNPTVFDILRNQKKGKGNEIQLSDSINTLASFGEVDSVLFQGNWFDCGSVAGYFDAIKFIAKKNKIDS